MKQKGNFERHPHLLDDLDHLNGVRIIIAIAFIAGAAFAGVVAAALWLTLK